MSGKITITNQSDTTAVIDIEGVIGVPEEGQFDDPESRVATYETFRSVLRSIREVRTPRIIVNIRSTGGNVNDALLMLDALKSLDSEVTTRCYGYVASAATVIAQAASPGRREISANALYLIHRAACSAEGNASELSQTIEMLNKTDERLAAVYAARSGRDPEQFAQLMAENGGNGRWLSPREALEYGLADRIIPAEPVRDTMKQNLRPGTPPIPNLEKIENMNMTQRWKALLDRLGIAPHTGPALSTARQQATVLTDRKISASPVLPLPAQNGKEEARMIRTESGSTLQSAGDKTLALYQSEIEMLRNRILQLEARNARLQAGPTATRPKEDPSLQESRNRSNDTAYMEDARKFRE